MSLGRAGDMAEFTVANSGPGIPPEILPRVRDRFRRGDAAHSQMVDGCGLDLSLAQWIVPAHHGSIQVEFVPSKTTTVTVRLRLAQEYGPPS